MPKRDVDILIEDILAAIGKIDRYVAGLDREGFLADDKTIDAVVRNLEIIWQILQSDLPQLKSQLPVPRAGT